MDQQQLRQNKFANMVQTIKLIAGMAIILGLIGYAVGGRWVALGAILVALITGGIGPSVSAQMVLRMFKARRLDPAQAHQLFELRDILCRRAELRSFPALYYIPSRVLNAFATGSQDHYAIAMTDGLLRALNHRELAGVLAHEISHIRHRDVRIMALADSFSRIISTLSRFALLAIIVFFPFALFTGGFGMIWRLLVVFTAPILTTFLQLALSRSREFHADMGAVELTHDPAGLASALKKLERMQPRSVWQQILYPANRGPESAVLRSHPHTHKRIEVLMDLVPRYEGQ